MQELLEFLEGLHDGALLNHAQCPSLLHALAGRFSRNRLLIRVGRRLAEFNGADHTLDIVCRS